MYGLEKYTIEQLKEEINMRDEISGETPQAEPVERQEAPQEYDCVCSECGKETTVPFQPRKDWPVYCRDCYAKRRR